MQTCEVEWEAIIFIYLAVEANNSKASSSFIASRNQKVFYRMLSMVEKRQRDRRIPRIALHDPSVSSWRKLYHSNNDPMITLTGLDHCTFGWLLDMFCPVYQKYTPFTKTGEINELSGKPGGCPRLMNAADCLGLNLAWTRFRGSTVALQLIFGMTATSVSMYLKFGRHVLILLLKNQSRLGNL